MYLYAGKKVGGLLSTYQMPHSCTTDAKSGEIERRTQLSEIQHNADW